ncbi:MAG: replicative DNA helicase [Armatimonadota bacterium]
MNGTPILDRVPPQNIEAEQSTLGSMMLDKMAVERVIEILRPEDFYREAHQRIYSAMWHLAERGEPVDLVTLTDELRARGQLEAVGGVSYLTTLLDSVPTAANAEYYARIVRDRAVLRGLIQAAAEITKAAYEPTEDVASVVDKAEQAIFAVSRMRGERTFRPVGELAIEAWERLSQQSEGGLVGVPTGFRELNAQTAGLQPADLIIIAARPSVGKTAFALNLALSAARSGRGPVAIFSLEMSDLQLAMRMLCAEARVSAHRLRSGNPQDDDWSKLASALDVLSELPIYVDDSSDLTPLQVRAKCRRLAASHGLGMVVIDYIQLMAAHGRAENRNQELSIIARSLKAMAKEFNVPVVALSQLSRAVEKREDKRPMLSDLRESGAIEAEADLVAFLHRPGYYEKPDEQQDPTVPEEVEVIIAKHRNGPTGVIKVGFVREYACFVDIERHLEYGG